MAAFELEYDAIDRLVSAMAEYDGKSGQIVNEVLHGEGTDYCAFANLRAFLARKASSGSCCYAGSVLAGQWHVIGDDRGAWCLWVFVFPG